MKLIWPLIITTVVTGVNAFVLAAVAGRFNKKAGKFLRDTRTYWVPILAGAVLVITLWLFLSGRAYE